MISLYLDDFSTIEEIIFATKELSIRRIPLRNIEGKNIYDMELEELQEVQESLRKEKIRVSILDITASYDLYNLLDFKKIFSIAKVFNCKDVIIKMPKFNNFEAEKTHILDVYNKIIDDFRKERLNVTFSVDYLINSAYLAFLIQEINNINFSFSPAECYESEKSITTYYRLLKRNINNVILYDVDEHKKPSLLGYGKALILDVIDKLNSDKYKGDIYYDSNLQDYVENRRKTRSSIFSKLFRRKKRRAHIKIDKRLRLDKDQEVELIEILRSQLKFIRMYQKS